MGWKVFTISLFFVIGLSKFSRLRPVLAFYSFLQIYLFHLGFKICMIVHIFIIFVNLFLALAISHCLSTFCISEFV